MLTANRVLTLDILENGGFPLQQTAFLWDIRLINFKSHKFCGSFDNVLSHCDIYITCNGFELLDSAGRGYRHVLYRPWPTLRFKTHTPLSKYPSGNRCCVAPLPDGARGGAVTSEAMVSPMRRHASNRDDIPGARPFITFCSVVPVPRFESGAPQTR